MEKLRALLFSKDSRTGGLKGDGEGEGGEPFRKMDATYISRSFGNSLLLGVAAGTGVALHGGLKPATVFRITLPTTVVGGVFFSARELLATSRHVDGPLNGALAGYLAGSLLGYIIPPGPGSRALSRSSHSARLAVTLAAGGILWDFVFSTIPQHKQAIYRFAKPWIPMEKLSDKEYQAYRKERRERQSGSGALYGEALPA